MTTQNSRSKPRPITWEREGECIVITSHRPRYGYIYVVRNGKSGGLHRMVCERRHGALGKLYAIHSCDNPRCVNPDHLRPGTPAENVEDRVKRGRSNRFAPGTHPSCKLTVEQVQEIRTSKLSGHAIARRFGVSQPTICLIRTRKNWRALK